MVLSEAFGLPFVAFFAAILGEEVGTTQSLEPTKMRTSTPFYVDFHTHGNRCEKYLEATDVFVVQSMMWGLEAIHPRSNGITVGIHPMQADAGVYLRRFSKCPAEWVETLVRFARCAHAPVVGIGECGWDKRSALAFDEQDLLFELHLHAACVLNLPLIIHSVGGLHRLLHYRKKLPDQLSLWLHGFRGNSSTLTQLLQAGVRLSLHPFAIDRLGISLEDFLDKHIRFETDDTPIDVRSLYCQAARKWGVETSLLQHTSLL